MARRTANQLIERDTELGGLDAMVASARAGSGRVALLEGEAGIGKTALLEHVCARGAAAGLTALSARGSELDREFAWGVVRQLFDRPLASSSPRQRAALFADSAALARPALGLGIGVAVTAETSFSTLHGLYWLTVNLDSPGSDRGRSFARAAHASSARLLPRWESADRGAAPPGRGSGARKRCTRGCRPLSETGTGRAATGGCAG